MLTSATSTCVGCSRYEIVECFEVSFVVLIGDRACEDRPGHLPPCGVGETIIRKRVVDQAPWAAEAQAMALEVTQGDGVAALDLTWGCRRFDVLRQCRDPRIGPAQFSRKLCGHLGHASAACREYNGTRDEEWQQPSAREQHGRRSSGGGRKAARA